MLLYTAVYSELLRRTESTQKEIDAYITISDAKTKEELDAKNVNSKTGRYIFIALPGKYVINITCKGNKPVQQEIIIYDKSDFTSEVERNFTLVPDK